AFAFTLNPFYLRGDFNGDGKPDTAILVKTKSRARLESLFFTGGTNEVYLVGAETTVGDGGDHFSWMDTWQVYAKARAHPKLIGEGFTGRKERIRRRILLGREKLHVATAGRLSSCSSGEARLPQPVRALISLRSLR